MVIILVRLAPGHRPCCRSHSGGDRGGRSRRPCCPGCCRGGRWPHRAAGFRGSGHGGPGRRRGHRQRGIVINGPQGTLAGNDRGES